MISEERLKELIKRKINCYVLYPQTNKICELNTNQFAIVDGEIYSLIEFYRNGTHEKMKDFSNLYETKEETEFVAKYHCSKTIKFEPPIFEEFMQQSCDWQKQWSCFNDGSEIELSMECDEDYIYVKDLRFGDYEHFTYRDLDTQKQAYYQAVEYAKKLFLGEE